MLVSKPDLVSRTVTAVSRRRSLPILAGTDVAPAAAGPLRVHAGKVAKKASKRSRRKRRRQIDQC